MNVENGPLFVDVLSTSALLRLVLLHRVTGVARCFERGSRSAHTIARVGAFLRLLPPVAEVMERYSELRYQDGRSDYIELMRDSRRLSVQIRDNWVRHDPLVVSLGRIWPQSLILMHFDRLLEEDLLRECKRISMVRWLSATAAGSARGAPVLLLSRRPWLRALADHARARGVRVVGHGWPVDLAPALRALGRLSRVVAHRSGRSGGRDPRAEESGRSVAALQVPGATLAVQYGYRTLDVSPAERSELFWLQDHLPKDMNVLVHGYNSPRPIAGDTLRTLQRMRVRVVGAALGATLWRPTLGVLKIALQPALLLVRGVRLGLPRPQLFSPFIGRQLARLVLDYGYWYEFFAVHGVRVHVAPMNSGSSVGQVLALRALNGISASYQLSIANIVAPSATLSTGEDVQFVFSDRFRSIWEGVAGRPRTFVTTGFLYDAAVYSPQLRQRARQLRERLERSGATFVLTFFDENSHDRWHSTSTNEDEARDYGFVLRWLLEDPSLGLVVKPKRGNDVLARIASVGDLLDSARRTGRLILLQSDFMVGNYPAEAALAGDIAIANLIGATAALEARLAGRPAVLVDTRGLRDHPFYRWGAGHVVFKDWPALRGAAEAYRMAPQEHSRFGDWSGVIDEFDPFRDGQAAQRMRDFLFAVWVALGQGLSREAALERAQAMFARRWAVDSRPRAAALTPR